MYSSAPSLDVNLEPEGFIVDLDSLYAYLARLKDARCARGVRYALVTVLLFVVLAKLAGQDRLFGIAEWVKHRKDPLAQAFHLKKARAPHASTYSRLLGKVVNLPEFERVVHEFFAEQAHAGESIAIALDGKTMRGSLRAGETHGIHLLAAFLPQEGWVLMQVEVGRKENEIRVAPQILQALDLRDKVVTGDAMLAQRSLSAQVVEAGGHYLWTVKENQPEVYADIARLFAPEPVVKGFSPASHDDFETLTTFDKGHGRHEWRTITVSSALQGYLDWPYVAQVFQLETRVVRVADGQEFAETRYGLTSLTRAQADPAQLLALKRGHWAIENGLHYRRDETLREDGCHLRRGTALQAMAIINNLVLGLLLRQGVRNVPQRRRFYDAHWQHALPLLFCSPA